MVPNMRPDDCHRSVVWKQDVFRFPRAYTYFYYGKYLLLYILSQTTTKEIEVFSIQSTCWFTRSRTSVTLQVVRPPSVLFPFFYHSAPRASRPTSESLDIPIHPYTAPGHVWCGSSSFAPSNTYWPPPIYPHFFNFISFPKCVSLVPSCYSLPQHSCWSMLFYFTVVIFLLFIARPTCLMVWVAVALQPSFTVTIMTM